MLLLFGSEQAADGWLVTINGVEREVREWSWRIRKTANGRGTFQCEILSEVETMTVGGGGGGFLLLLGSGHGEETITTAPYRPALDEEVIVYDEYGDVIFGGLITSVRESGPDGLPVEDIVSSITATDYNVLAERRYVNDTIPAGSTLKDALTLLVPYLEDVTLDPTQVDGPTMEELVYEDVLTKDVLDDLSVASSGYIWEIDENRMLRMYEPGSLTAPFDITEAAQVVIGDVVVEPTRDNYANRVIVRNKNLRAVAEDLVEQAAHGIWEVVYTAADTNGLPALQALADMILIRSTPVLRRAFYVVDERGLRPGQTQGIDLESRDLDNTFLLTDVEIATVPNSQTIRYTVNAIEGLVYQTGWQETYRRWNSGGGLTINGGGIGGAQALRFAYFLGGGGTEAVVSDGPDWVPVAGGADPDTGSFQVQVNTIPRGTTLATVVVRMRALTAGVSVKARLYDVTDDTPCPGESATVTNTNWETKVFTATLTAGSHFYELQLLPGAANEPVMGVGYLE